MKLSESLAALRRDLGAVAIDADAKATATTDATLRHLSVRDLGDLLRAEYRRTAAMAANMAKLLADVPTLAEAGELAVRLEAENADLRRQLAEARAANDT